VASADGFGFEVDSETSATIHLNPRVYTKEAILRACYWLTDVAYNQRDASWRAELPREAPAPNRK
jgi:hypothetical protein